MQTFSLIEGVILLEKEFVPIRWRLTRAMSLRLADFRRIGVRALRMLPPRGAPAGECLSAYRLNACLRASSTSAVSIVGASGSGIRPSLARSLRSW